MQLKERASNLKGCLSLDHCHPLILELHVLGRSYSLGADNALNDKVLVIEELFEAFSFGRSVGINEKISNSHATTSDMAPNA
ncbi:hypothetical protein [Lysobacter sp. CFH 32150]|uniref:hypothetical protein n=1 Tax=Lysobacter sp. CFH 32150 TaxID=2927128 RepID=UPI001FA7835F|nr:hypothetical protein [Lysobacter sp. CFH 32150]MCI4569497.1 hypothetical protein [Lysobacter sp. CFH 32150]